jgi:hypothetical protein
LPQASPEGQLMPTQEAWVQPPSSQTSPIPH